MTELKTLKDIEFKTIYEEAYKSESFKKGTKVYSKKKIDKLRYDLRVEAVKWYHKSDGNKHKFIKQFFNLTDNDLKARTSETEVKE